MLPLIDSHLFSGERFVHGILRSSWNLAELGSDIEKVESLLVWRWLTEKHFLSSSLSRHINEAISLPHLLFRNGLFISEIDGTLHSFGSLSGSGFDKTLLVIRNYVICFI